MWGAKRGLLVLLQKRPVETGACLGTNRTACMDCSILLQMISRYSV